MLILQHSLITLAQPTGARVSARNTTLPDFCFVAAKCCALADPAYALRFCYVEFENVAAPNDAVTLPTVDPTNPAHGRAYYAGLGGSSVRDYLRVPLVAAPILQNSSELAPYFAGRPGAGHVALLMSQTAGTTGVGGRPFNHTVNSKVFGVAIVAAPVPSDPTQDVVVLRAYYAAQYQQLKLAAGQIAITIETPFGL
jgi:hypothetical protein